jgi:hypothetical protein
MRFRLGCALSICLVSCGDRSDVTLSAALDQAAVSATDGPLGTSVSGSFRLKLELGPDASGPTTVTLGSFALQDSAGAVLIDPLQVSASGATFPLSIAKGGMQAVNFTISSGKVLASADRALLCAGPVRIAGSVMDSLKGGTDPLLSVPVMPSCP